jgi:hypothetical protein
VVVLLCVSTEPSQELISGKDSTTVASTIVSSAWWDPRLRPGGLDASEEPRPLIIPSETIDGREFSNIFLSQRTRSAARTVGNLGTEILHATRRHFGQKILRTTLLDFVKSASVIWFVNTIKHATIVVKPNWEKLFPQNKLYSQQHTRPRVNNYILVWIDINFACNDVAKQRKWLMCNYRRCFVPP